MCGPFALMAGTPHPSEPTPRSRTWPILGYHLGRLLVYSIIGIVFGWLGMAVDLGGRVAGLQSAATISAGAMMITVGLIALGRQFGFSWQAPSMARLITLPLQKLFQRISRLPRAMRSVALGMLTSLMPCGWLYVFAIIAAGVAHPFWGWVVMVVFWSGTVPILLVSVLGLGQLANRVRFNVPMATAIMVIVIGCFTLFYRAPVKMTAPIAISTSVSEQIETLNHIDQEELPCCQGK
jgi:sulfite exporter TauE/SafE